jgi:hypothetical protein
LSQDDDSDSGALAPRAAQAKPKLVLRFPARRDDAGGDPPADPLRRTRAAAAMGDSDEEEDEPAPPPRTRHHAREAMAYAPSTHVVDGRKRLRKAA